MLIFTFHISGRGHIFGSVRVCVCLCVCLFALCRLNRWTYCSKKVKVVGQGHRVKVKVVWGVLYPIDSREVRHGGVFINIWPYLDSHSQDSDTACGTVDFPCYWIFSSQSSSQSNNFVTLIRRWNQITTKHYQNRYA